MSSCGSCNLAEMTNILRVFFSYIDLDNHPHLLTPAQLECRESELRSCKEQQKQQLQDHEDLSRSASSSLFDTDSKVIEELECPVCLEDMRPPKQIYSCTNAHLFCQKCNILQLKNCPKCREDFRAKKPARNRLAERWACKIFQ